MLFPSLTLRAFNTTSERNVWRHCRRCRRPSECRPVVHVSAAALKPVDKRLAGGFHYASPRELPLGYGADWIGHLRPDSRTPATATRTATTCKTESLPIRRINGFSIALTNATNGGSAGASVSFFPFL